MVRRARRINRELAEVYSVRPPRAGLREPLPAARRHGPVRPDHRPAGQPDDARALRRIPHSRGHGRGRSGGAGGDPAPDRLLPGQDQVRAGAVGGPAGQVRRRGARRLKDLVDAARRRAARPPFVVLGNAFGVPGHHRRHPLRAAGAPLAAGPSRRTRTRSRRRSPRSSRRASGRCSRTASIFHGRRICHARKPACGACPIAPLCPSYGEGETDPEKAKKLLKYEMGGMPGPASEASAGLPGPAGARRWAATERPGERTARTGVRHGDGAADRRALAHDARHAAGTHGVPSSPTTDGLPGWLEPVVHAADTVEPSSSAGSCRRRRRGRPVGRARSSSARATAAPSCC